MRTLIDSVFGSLWALRSTAFCSDWYLFTDWNSQISPIRPICIQYSWYFFEYETGGVPILVHWFIRFISAISAGTVRYWLPWYYLDDASKLFHNIRGKLQLIHICFLMAGLRCELITVLRRYMRLRSFQCSRLKHCACCPCDTTT